VSSRKRIEGACPVTQRKERRGPRKKDEGGMRAKTRRGGGILFD